MAGYDPKKAATYNKLRQGGLSEDQAWKQAGLTDADEANYVINDSPYNADGTKNTTRGQMGAFIAGTGTQTTPYTAAEKAESDAYYNSLGDTKNVQRVDYPVKANSSVKTKTTETWTSTSTEQVSGGGSTTITAGAFKENATTRALQPEIDAKQAELKQSYKDYPVSNRGREKAGLPLLTPDELQANQQRATEISKQKVALEYKQQDAGTPGEPTTTTVPNTTTNTSTTTYSKTVTNSGLSNVTNVQTPGGADPTVNAQYETQVATTDVPVGNQVSTPNPVDTPLVADPTVTVPDEAPAPVEPSNSPYASQRAQQIEDIQAATPEPEPDPYDNRFNRQEAAAAEAANNEYEAETARLNRVEAAAAEDQPDPYDNRFARQEAEAAEAADNESTAETARLNRTGIDPNEDPAAAQADAQAQLDEAVAKNDAELYGGVGGYGAVEAGIKQKAQEQQALQARFNTPANGDWRVRIRLAPNSNYLYNAASPGILAPLKASDGVIFPYTPSISTSYNAEYDVTDLTHSNYRGQFYKSSNVGDIAINGTFTAQDTQEAEYMLAVIHFFRSVTKMFYGQDAQRGAPPPLVYLFGLGQYQFNNHPCLVKSFNYSLPTDVDYIRTQPNNYGQNLLNRRTPAVSAPSNGIASVVSRLSNAVDKLGNILKPGALPDLGSFLAGQPGVSQQAVNNTSNATYVPTKIEIQLSLLPIQTRNQVSQQFSLKGFASGDLLRGGFW